MGCSDNWARANIDREEVQQRHEKERQKLMQRRYSNDHPDEVNAINGVTELNQQNEDKVARALRYAAQLNKVVSKLTDDELEYLLLNDLEFRSVFIELQESNKEAGRDWIECKFRMLIYIFFEQVKIIRHKVDSW